MILRNGLHCLLGLVSLLLAGPATAQIGLPAEVPRIECTPKILSGYVTVNPNEREAIALAVDALQLTEQLELVDELVWSYTVASLEKFAPDSREQWLPEIQKYTCKSRAIYHSLRHRVEGYLQIVEWMDGTASGKTISQALRDGTRKLEQANQMDPTQLPPKPEMTQERSRLLLGIAQSPNWTLYQYHYAAATSQILPILMEGFRNKRLALIERTQHHEIPQESSQLFADEMLSRIFADVDDVSLQEYLQFLYGGTVRDAMNDVALAPVKVAGRAGFESARVLRKYIPEDVDLMAFWMAHAEPQPVAQAETDSDHFDEPPPAQAPEPVRSVEALMAEAEETYRTTYAYGQVAQLLTQVLAIDPNRVRAVTLLGIVTSKSAWQGEWEEGMPLQRYDQRTADEAKMILSRALALSDDELDAHVEMGYIEFNHENYEEARRRYDLAEARGSQYPYLGVYQGELERQLGNLQASFDHYAAVLRNPAHRRAYPEAAWGLVHYHLNDDNAEDIAAVFKESLTGSPLSRSVNLAYGDVVLRSGGDLDHALSSLGQIEDKARRYERYSERFSALLVAKAWRDHADPEGLTDPEGTALVQKAIDSGASMYRVALTLADSAFAGGALVLFRSGADFESNPLAPTGLLYALLEAKQYEMARSLLELGVPPEYPGPGHVQPLHRAVYNRDLEAVRLLMSVGADPNVTNRTRQKPVDLLEDDQSDVGRQIRTLLIY